MSREDRFITLVGLLCMLVVVVFSCVPESTAGTDVLPPPAESAAPSATPEPSCNPSANDPEPRCPVLLVTPPPMPRITPPPTTTESVVRETLVVVAP